MTMRAWVQGWQKKTTTTYERFGDGGRGAGSPPEDNGKTTATGVEYDVLISLTEEEARDVEHILLQLLPGMEHLSHPNRKNRENPPGTVSQLYRELFEAVKKAAVDRKAREAQKVDVREMMAREALDSLHK